MSFEQKEIDNAVKLDVPKRPGVYLMKYDSPISTRENIRLNYQHKGMWVPNARDFMWFTPEIVPDNPCRAMVTEATPYTGPVGGLDMFGREWVYEPKSRGSIVRPGNPMLTDISKWREVIQFPDVDSWDWEGSAAKNKDFLEKTDKYPMFCIFTGFFERLISFMDAGPALVSMRSSRTRPYAIELLNALADLYIDIVDHAAKAYGKGIDGFIFHDDWGAQDAPFFGEKQCMEVLVPPMRRVTDHIHALGYTTEIHSCGKNDKLVGCYVAAGWDSWDGMAINDFSADCAAWGDKLMIRTPVKAFPENAPKEEVKAYVEGFVEEFCHKDRPIVISYYVPASPETQNELYRQTRIKYEG